MGILYLVATPIGNLEDMTLRAIRTLKRVDLVLAEDTRQTAKLLRRYGIRTPQKSFHEHSEIRKIPAILAKLGGGESIAVVSDAGTPLISDPGFKLVREAQRQGIKVVSIPGPSAILAALTISGLPPDKFTFLGYLPRTESGRRKLFTDLRRAAKILKTTFVAFESPHRIKKTLADLAETLPEAEVALARELTKVHEELKRGAPNTLLASLENETPKGEITLVIRVS